MKVSRIEYAGKADTFNMEVDETHDFVVNNGVVVHNCFDCLRYVCAENPIASKSLQPIATKVYDPLSVDTLESRVRWY